MSKRQLYTYDALANSVEERVFIESSRSFAALEAELGELAYVNNDQQFYLFLDGNIVRIEDVYKRKIQTDFY